MKIGRIAPGKPGDADTRTKLILAGERLFGEKGIDAVPLTEIVAAAGQRNASALAYHVGGRSELLRAILDFRREHVDARRLELLDAYEEGDVVMDEAAIASALVLPLVELMLSDPSGGNYLRFLSQIYVTERPDWTYRTTAKLERGIQRCAGLYRARHPDTNVNQLNERFEMCTRGAIYPLADWQRDLVVPRTRIPRTKLIELAGVVIAMTASGLTPRREDRFKPFQVLPPRNAPHGASRKTTVPQQRKKEFAR